VEINQGYTTMHSQPLIKKTWAIVCDKVHWHTLLVNLSKLSSILAQVMAQNDMATEHNVIWETGPSALEKHTALVKVNQDGKVNR